MVTAMFSTYLQLIIYLGFNPCITTVTTTATVLHFCCTVPTLVYIQMP